MLIYEINTRVWLKQFSAKGNPLKLIDVPQGYWEDLKKRGFKYIWLMGIWQTVPSAIKKYCFVDGLKKEYDLALPDWKEDDVIGSPYAIDRYEVNPKIGSIEDIINLKVLLNDIGLKLILDFIPNHFHTESSLFKDHSDIFLKVNKDLHNKNDKTFFIEPQSGNYFAHGKDPYFEAWQDTLQVNYFSSEARTFMIRTLLEISTLCNGVRCDMSMLVLNSVFSNTWNDVKSIMNYKLPENEFWVEAISEVKKRKKGFIFIAEVYWDLEYQLQSLGFDYTYDKRLYDRLLKGEVQSIYEHLKADDNFQLKSVNFIENHDEKRSAREFGSRSQAAAVIMSTLPGLKLFYDGQFEGKQIKLPIQLGREPREEINVRIQKFYDKLLRITNDEIFYDGEFTLLTPEQVWPDNDTQKYILSWMWHYKNNFRLIIVNYFKGTSVCRIKFNYNLPNESTTFIDLLNDDEYSHPKDKIKDKGLYIQLESFESHIFLF